MKKYIKIPIIIFILDVILALLSNFWIDSEQFVILMFPITIGCTGFSFLNLDRSDPISVIYNFFGGSKYVVLILFSCFLYAFVCFFIGVAYLDKGNGDLINGVYYLNYKGHIVQEISK